MVEVDVGGAGQVPGGELLRPTGTTEPVADVEEGHRAEPSAELLDTDQGMHHGMILPDG
jgi:hypothetical protein